MALFDGHMYYTIGEGEFARLVGDRIKQLEVERFTRVMALAELGAIRPRLREDQVQAYDHDVKVIQDQIAETTARIEAVRSLTNEYEEPKVQ